MKSPYAILVVDDEEPVRKLLRSRFEREEYTVITAENADQAKQLLQEHAHIALVVTDIRMPGKSGLELTQEIKSGNGHRKVIVMTGHGEKSTAIEALRKGASDFIEKPFDMEEMVHSAVRTLREFTIEQQNLEFVENLRQQSGAPVQPSNVIPLKREFAAHAEDKMNYTRLKKQWTDQFEQDYIQKLLQKNNGNVTAAAKEAGLDRSNFLRLLRRHQIQAQTYRKAA